MVCGWYFWFLLQIYAHPFCSSIRFPWTQAPSCYELKSQIFAPVELTLTNTVNLNKCDAGYWTRQSGWGEKSCGAAEERSSQETRDADSSERGSETNHGIPFFFALHCFHFIAKYSGDILSLQ